MSETNTTDHGVAVRSTVYGYAESVLSDLRAFADDELPHYSDCLRHAFAETEPVFVRDRYGEFFWHCATTVPGWLGGVVLANAHAESDGSAKLLRLWKVIRANDRVATEVLAHARDEAGHSRLFVELARKTFPDTITRAAARAAKHSLTRIDPILLTKSATSVDEGTVIDHLIQMNIGEIRTRAHMHLLGPAIFAAASDTARSWVEITLERLAGDEVRHIGYTARLMETWCGDGQKRRIAGLYRTRLREFHALTVHQTEAAVHSYGQAKFPDLLEI